jgi:peptidoglycan/LPS O-acetylase OafA/YrhL
MRGFRLPPLKATSGELLHIDLLRFVASVGIVWQHSHEFFYDPQIRAEAITKTVGFNAFVDLFFVISGFIIAYVYSGKIDSPRQFFRFMQRRVARLVPLHWLTLLLSILLFWLFLKVGISLKHTPSFRLECIIDTAFLLHAVVPCGNLYFFNVQSWSISVEMIMYLAFPFFAMLTIRWRLAPFVLGGVILGSIFLRELVAGPSHWSAHVVLGALPSFLFGIGLYHYRSTLCCFPAPTALLVLMLLTLIGMMANGAPINLVLLLVYFTAAAAIAADMRGNPTKFVTKLAPLGQMTYSIYLWHGLFIMVIINGFGDKFLHLSRVPMTFLAILCYSLILGFSYLSFIFFETPARRWVDRLSLASVLPALGQIRGRQPYSIVRNIPYVITEPLSRPAPSVSGEWRQPSKT